jgi:hypothetical protein
MPNNETPLIITPESEQIARAVRAWLQTYSEKPVRTVDVEYLGDGTGLTISTVQAAYKTKKYITGGYQAQYQFSILYQTFPTTANERLEMDEVLNNYAVWAESTKPELPENCRFIRCTRNTDAALLGRDANGAEVHQIQFTLIYEVNV